MASTERPTCTHSGTREESSISGNTQTTTTICANPPCSAVISTTRTTVGTTGS